MAVLSTLCRSSLKSSLTYLNVSKTLLLAKQNAFKQALRHMSSDDEDRTFHITPSRFQYTKFKDDLHFYLTIGIVPMVLVMLYVNIFIGPATLTETPEGYEPKFWEYYKHPVKRFIARYIQDDPQVIHERNLHYLQEEQDRTEWRETIDKVDRLMLERQDYKAWYFVPSDQGKHIRQARKIHDELEVKRGYR